MLKRVHRSRIDVEIGIELLEHNAQPAQFEQRAERSRGQAFAKRTHDAAGDKNVFHRVDPRFRRAASEFGARSALGVLPACRRRAIHVW